MEKKNYLIITVGTRDVQLGKTPEETKQTFIQFFGEENYKLITNERGIVQARKFGDFLLANNRQRFTKARKQLLFPIIKPCLDYLKASNKFPHKIMLVVTDQPETVQPHSQSDTVRFGELLQTILSETYKMNGSAVKTFAVTEGVTYLDSMNALFSQELQQSSVFKELPSFDAVGLLNQGGIDAINTGLLFACIKILGKKLTHYCIDERTETCYELGFVQQTIAQAEREQALRFCECYEYAAMGAMDIDPVVVGLSRYAAARLHFDFVEAKKYLLAIQSSEFRTFVNSQISELKQIEENEDHLLIELYINAKIKFTQESYVDFLLRFFRIIEEIARQEAVSALGLTRFNHKTWRKDFQEKLSLTDYQDLAKFLSGFTLNGEQLKLDEGNIAVFQAINSFYQSVTYSLLDAVMPLAQLRNKSIGAHDFKPVSLTLIEKKLAEKKQGLTMAGVFEQLDNYLGVRQNPFDVLNQFIKIRLA